MSDKRYYWLKLQKDFFKRNDIQVVESMPNGKDYVLFYLKLLCEATSEEGRLRFSETIPYSPEMLSTITKTNVDIVRSAIKVFQELGMIDVLDDGTYYMTEVEKMIGSETKWAQYKRDKKQEIGKIPIESKKSPIEIDIEKEKEIDKDIDKDISNIACTDKSEQAVIYIPLNDNSEYPIYFEFVQEMQSLYPNVDVMAELRKMRGWSLSNPTKRKTKRGVKKFINNWLAKEQDKGNYTTQVKQPKQSSNPFMDLLMEMEGEQ